MNCALCTSPAFLLASLLLGCNSVDRFDTQGATAYCGSLVGAPFEEGLVPDGIRPRKLGLELKLNTAALTARGDTSVVVGKLSSDDTEWGLCAPSTGPLFAAAPLRTLPALDHDRLSLLEFGSGRDYNFFAWVDSTCQGTLLSVVSLMRNDDIEVRLFKPAPQAAEGAPPAEQTGFGLFFLQRRAEGCSE